MSHARVPFGFDVALTCCHEVVHVRGGARRTRSTPTPMVTSPVPGAEVRALSTAWLCDSGSSVELLYLATLETVMTDALNFAKSQQPPDGGVRYA